MSISLPGLLDKLNGFLKPEGLAFLKEARVISRFLIKRSAETTEQKPATGGERQIEPDFVPDKVRAFDRLYDPHTGGWKFPGWLHDSTSFDSDLIQEWVNNCAPYYGPVEREVAHFYKSIVQLVRPKVIIETGTNAGYSTSWLAAGLKACCPDGVVYTIDIGTARHLFEGTELQQNIRFLHGSSLEVPLDESIVADMLVLDSDHSYNTIMAEILRFEPILKVGGLMMLHDSIYFDGVAHAVHALMESDRFEVITLPTPRTHGYNTRPPGLTLVRKCAPTPDPNDLKYEQAYSDIGVGRDPLDREALLDRLKLRN